MSAPVEHELAIEYVPLSRLKTYPGNARLGDVDAIAESMDENGVFDAIVVQLSTQYVLDGNHRFMAMQQRGDDLAPVIYVDVDDDRARRIVLVANRTNDLASYDDALLVELLQGLPDLDGTGFTDDDLSGLLDGLNDLDLSDFDGDGSDGSDGDSSDGDTDDAAEPIDKGRALELFGSTVGEPDVLPATGSEWKLGRHTLVVSDVHKDWPRYVKHLTAAEGSLFWPYPSLLAPFTAQAKEATLILVQPNPYLAGWTITKWQRLTGQTAVEVTA